MLATSVVPDAFGNSIVIPLFKDKIGNVNSLDNYRGITLIPVVAKVFKLVVPELCKDCALTDDLQVGFTAKSGVLMPYLLFICLLIIFEIDTVLFMLPRLTFEKLSILLIILFIQLVTLANRSTTMERCQLFTTTTFAKRAFRCSAPAVWNSLPQTVLSSDSVAVFKLSLKTFLFSQAFSSFSAH